MSGTFNFCPNSLVPETLVPEDSTGTSMNGWFFASKPKVPYQRKFRVTLYGLRWYLNTNGTYNTTASPTTNARLLEQFYQANGRWDNFAWAHPHLGTLQVRFAEPVNVPKAEPNSNGLIEELEVVLVEHNPAYS